MVILTLMIKHLNLMTVNKKNTFFHLPCGVRTGSTSQPKLQLICGGIFALKVDSMKHAIFRDTNKGNWKGKSSQRKLYRQISTPHSSAC